jgi:hypothetical protein
MIDEGVELARQSYFAACMSESGRRVGGTSVRSLIWCSFVRIPLVFGYLNYDGRRLR